MVSFNGCVLATKISGTSASTSIAPEIFETSKDFAESVKLTFLFLIISSIIKSGRFESSDKSVLSI